MHKLSKAEVMREVKDYIYITLGLISNSLGWAAFLLPYQITTGGTTGIGAIIFYATGFPIQWSYFIINAVLMTFAIRILGPKFSIKTTYATFQVEEFVYANHECADRCIVRELFNITCHFLNQFMKALQLFFRCRYTSYVRNVPRPGRTV